jgi:hypothetical protein
MERIEKNGKELFVGDCVLVPEPSGNDMHNHEFMGTIHGFTKDGYAMVIDGDGDYFGIEPERLEFFDENIQLTPVEIIKLKKMVKSK